MQEGMHSFSVLSCSIFINQTFCTEYENTKLLFLVNQLCKAFQFIRVVLKEFE